MKGKLKHILLGIALLFCFQVNVQAAEEELVVSIPVKQSFEALRQDAATLDYKGSYELRAVQQDTPMPEGATEGCFRFELDGKEAEISVPFHYKHAGIYQYELRQIDRKIPKLDYDERVYRLHVYVKNAPEGKLLAEVIAETGEGSKASEVLFANRYEKQMQTTTVQTGDVAYGFWIVAFLFSAWMLSAFTVFKKQKQ